jgi:hypothetical protein
MSINKSQALAKMGGALVCIIIIILILIQIRTSKGNRVLLLQEQMGQLLLFEF